MTFSFPKPTKNCKAIALASRRIPYLPELRPYCQSITACILMTQLEYRFAGMPDGFYKFLSPCDHYLYKKGDSWIEELGFSEGEFRTAFDNIGIRYRSKKHLQEVFDAHQDPFQGKLYLSFIDVKNGVTYYQRNHDLAYSVIGGIVDGFTVHCEPQPEPAPQLEPLEIRQLHSQRLTNPISSPFESELPLKEHKKTTKENTEEAREEPLTSLSDFGGQPFSASADFVLNDFLIGEALTLKQRQEVELAVRRLHPEYLSQLSLSEAIEVVSVTVLDPKSYTKAGKEFALKLNTIKKSISQGSWTPPLSYLSEKQRAEELALEAKRKAQFLAEEARQAKEEQETKARLLGLIQSLPSEQVKALLLAWKDSSSNPFILDLVKKALIALSNQDIEVYFAKSPGGRAIFSEFLRLNYPALYINHLTTQVSGQGETYATAD